MCFIVFQRPRGGYWARLGDCDNDGFSEIAGLVRFWRECDSRTFGTILLECGHSIQRIALAGTLSCFAFAFIRQLRHFVWQIYPKIQLTTLSLLK